MSYRDQDRDQDDDLDQNNSSSNSHEYAGFLSGGNPAGHNEFRFTGFSSSPVNSPHDDDYDYGHGGRGGHGAGGGLGDGGGLGGGGLGGLGGGLGAGGGGGLGLGRRLQRWGANLGTGHHPHPPHHQGQHAQHAHRAPTTTSYATPLPSSTSSTTRALSQMNGDHDLGNNLNIVKRITNLSHLGERLWGGGPTTSLDLNQLIMNEDWGLAGMECRMRPHLAGRWLERSGFFMGRHSASVLPLHQAVALRPPVEMIQTLVITYPAGIKAKETSFGRLPLHVACRSGASPEAVECLLAYHPDGSREGDTLQRIPLHYALKNDAGVRVVQLLLEAYPEGVTRSDHRGWMPLHVACSMGTDLDIIELLLEDHPETVLRKTHKGSDCVKCARMSRGHPNEEDIVSFMEERMREEEEASQREEEAKEGGGNDDGGVEEEKTDGNGGDDDDDGDDDDESHHENDDDLIDFTVDAGSDGEEEKDGGGPNTGEVDLLGLAASGGKQGDGSTAAAVDQDKGEDLLLDLDNGGADTNIIVAEKETPASIPDHTNANIPPMPAEAPPPPPPPPPPEPAVAPPQSKDEDLLLGLDDTPNAKKDGEDSPTSAADDIVEAVNSDETGPATKTNKNDTLSNGDTAAHDDEGDLLDLGIEDGSDDIVKALEGNLIDL